VIHIDVPLRHDLLEITQAERISQITTNAQNDDFWREMSPLEQGWPLRSHEGPSLTDQLRHFATHPYEDVHGNLQSGQIPESLPDERLLGLFLLLRSDGISRGRPWLVSSIRF
jgi:hypothetical protein